ncbi:GatB/YqeY domain-containing protein [Salinisphaera sp. USBA-960]|nr:GatB/YqeY domain-containing protein [Salifodinibacter halophilus]NNC26421.1 GatB/YqeY domain-containing protein [Salifodinibacter halophilus]
MSIQDQLATDLKEAMRARDKARMGVIRMAQSELKQREIDEGALDDTATVGAIEKMVKKRRDAEAQYRDADRQDLADAEAAEAEVLQGYLPSQLGEAEIDAEIERVINETGAESMRDMGSVMAVLKPSLQGRADLGEVSTRVKARLAG